MSFANPAFHIDRVPVVGEEPEFVKMFDPPTVSPALPEALDPTNLPLGVKANPMPEVMAAAGLGTVKTAHTVQRDLINGLNIKTWDNRSRGLNFFLVGDDDFAPGPHYPGPIVRVPRGVIFHAQTQGKGPPPHTIHWHGQEPTPMNDGVGHCSMEIGQYIYQMQPNFIGTYFYHCHRNTVQHFEFGLFSMFIVEPPDAYFASLNPDGTLNNIPVGACSDGRFRTAANLLNVPVAKKQQRIQDKFPGFVAGDPVYGVGGANDVGVGHPHAFTVPYDVEALWVFDDRDSRWSDDANDAFATFPRHGLQPGVNDDFRANDNGFFAFNDFRPDYFFVTGVPVPAPKGGMGIINPSAPPPPDGVGGIGGAAVPDGLIPPALNGGRGMRGSVEEPALKSQIAVNARVNQTILVRSLNAAYNNVRLTFPLEVVIIEWDGRALGVPPYARYNHAFVLPANTPIEFSVARRFSVLARSSTPISSFATAEFLDTRGGDLNMTARIPFNITA